jgi:hypothetical protein
VISSDSYEQSGFPHFQWKLIPEMDLTIFTDAFCGQMGSNLAEES